MNTQSIAAPPVFRMIFPFGPGQELEPPPKERLGGKGASLAAMNRAGLHVPPGFIIPTDCCRLWNEGGGRFPDGLMDEVAKAMEWLESVANRKFGTGKRPLLVSVRSGAAVSMPGMMDTVLNVGINPSLEGSFPDKEAFWSAFADFARLYSETVMGVSDEGGNTSAPGEASSAPEALSAAARARDLVAMIERTAGRKFPTDPWEQLREAIGAVFASWDSERARHYRTRHNIRGLPGTAVTVQMMFPSERSGVLFTTDPTTFDENRLIIESSLGLGEAIVRGRVEPDVFIIDRATMSVVEERISEKDVQVRALSETASNAREGSPPGGSDASSPGGREPSLSRKQVLDLAMLGIQVEKYFGHPVDLEWGWADGRFGLLQSRPVRGIEVARDVPAALAAEKERLRGRIARSPQSVWAVHNLSETLPAPLPLTWDIVGSFMSATGGFGRLYEDAGFHPSDRVRREGFLELIGGRVYIDLQRGAELFYDDFPLEYDLAGGAAGTDVLTAAPSKFNVERAGGGFLLRLPWYIYLMIRQGRVFKRLAGGWCRDFLERALPPFLSKVDEGRKMDLEALGDAEVLAELGRREALFNEFGKESLKPGFVAGYYHARLSADLELVFGPQEGKRLTGALLKGLEGDRTVEANIDLYKVSRGEMAMAAFLETYGHRAVGELELSEPRWWEDPGYPGKIVGQFRQAAGPSPVELHRRQVLERQETEKYVFGELPKRGASSLAGEIRFNFEQALLAMPYRETGKYYFMMAVDLVRRALVELARRWDLGRDLFFLRRDELARFAGEADSLRKEIASRKIRWAACQRIDLPELITASDIDGLGGRRLAADAGGSYTGTAVAPGVNTGIARIVKSPQDVADLGTRYVIVCSSTDPGWTPLFVHARGLIVERGGMLSHGAIVARDFGIPAVVLKDATRLIPDGAEIRVDGNSGRIELVEAGKGA